MLSPTLVQIRNQKDGHKKDTAHRIGCNPSLIHKWEQGKRVPSGFMLSCWVEALDAQNRNQNQIRSEDLVSAVSATLLTPWFVCIVGENVCIDCYEEKMASSERNKGRYHEHWWCKWFSAGNRLRSRESNRSGTVGRRV